MFLVKTYEKDNYQLQTLIPVDDTGEVISPIPPTVAFRCLGQVPVRIGPGPNDVRVVPINFVFEEVSLTAAFEVAPSLIEFHVKEYIEEVEKQSQKIVVPNNVRIN